ncbi:MAG: NACHT domain-containing protein, partial [Scytonema sp. PMC 1069.18]|nr:NACHT domain-containing protein [Scytonema sp. PMC 1069.18]
MQIADNKFTPHPLSTADQEELDKLINHIELSSGTTSIFAIAPESGPQHPIVENLKSLISESDENFKPENFFYSNDSLHNFLYSLRETNQQNQRKLLMVFGIDQLPTPRLVREMRQLNLGRDTLFEKKLILIFWLNREEFLEEFRHRAPDFWDWRGKVLKFTTRPVFNPLLYPYLEWLIAENSYLKISGVMQVQRQVDIFLDQIYISLQAVRRQEITETSEREQRGLEIGKYPEIDIQPISTSTKTIVQKVNLSHAVRAHQYSVILGAPGAGKTTLLRYLALHFALAKRDSFESVIDGEAKEDLGKTLLPIFFRIADYAEQLQQQPDLTLREYLRQFYQRWETSIQNEVTAETQIGTLLLEKMRQGECLMLLDGLDEVFDQQSRRLIVERINQFVDDYWTNKFIITSRIAGYQDVKLSSRFAEFTIEDMSSELVERFLQRWCKAIEQAQQPEAGEEQWERTGNSQAQQILEAIKDNEGIKRLTANPLLLTILALIHRNGERLPNRRVKLYELAVQTLTEDWQLGKKLPDASKVLLSQNEVVELLAPLAYWMHEEKPSGLVTEVEVKEKLSVKLAELNDIEPESDFVAQAVQEFLRKVRETTGLLVERAPGVYGFMHLTFEEYFAARYIADNQVSDILEIIREHLHEPRWKEPLLLALGYYGAYFRKQVNKLVEQLFKPLEDYKPALQYGNIKINNASSPNAIIIWQSLQNDPTTSSSYLEFPLENLLFAGQVIAEVEVNSSFRKKLIEKIVLTAIGLEIDSESDTVKQLLRLLRQIEIFNQKGEVIAQLKQYINDLTLSEFVHIRAQLAILYVACGESGKTLIDCVTEIVNQLNPLLFSNLKKMIAELGEEMTPALEATCQNWTNDQLSTQSLTFLTALSYVRTDNYERAIALLEELLHQQDNHLICFVYWAIADCYQAQEKYHNASNY